MCRLADGDRTAFEPVYAALWPVLCAFCSRLLGDLDAEDAAQLAILKLFDRAASFDPDRDALSWALAIAAWECRTARKRRGRRREAALDDAFTLEEPAASPEARNAQAQLEAAAQEVLGVLSEADRETLHMTMMDEAPAGVAAATFRKRRERALDRLRSAWRRIHGS